MAEERRESELLWPSNNKEGGRKREKKKTENETVEENWPVTAIRDIVSLSSLSPLLSSLVSWRAAVSKSHPTIYPFPSPSTLPRGERRLLGAIRLSDRTVPDSEPDPGIRAPSLHWTLAEMHAGKDLV